MPLVPVPQVSYYNAPPHAPEAPFERIGPIDQFPAAWYDVSHLTGKTNADLLAQIDDLSRNGRHMLQATVGARPVYVTGVLNGLPVARFDGVDDYVTAFWAQAQPTTRFVVGRYRSARVANDTMTDGGTFRGAWLFRSPTDNEMRTYVDSGPEFITLTTTPEAWHVYTQVFDGAASSFRIDAAAATTGNPGSGGSNGATWGGTASGTEFGPVDLAAELVYDGVLSAGDQTTVRAALAAQFGL